MDSLTSTDSESVADDTHEEHVDLSPPLPWLKVQGSGLYGLVGCRIRLPHSKVHYYQFTERNGEPGFVMEERDNALRFQPVVKDTVMVMRSHMVTAMRANRDMMKGWDGGQAFLLDLLEQQRFEWLEAHGFGLYVMSQLSVVAHTDYPYVYWFILASALKAGRLDCCAGVISREVLAQALNVDQLSDAQLKALRKLAITSNSRHKDIAQAIHLIVHGWASIDNSMTHMKDIPIPVLLEYEFLLSLEHCVGTMPWFTLAAFQAWLENKNRLENTESDDVSMLFEANDRIRQFSMALYVRYAYVDDANIPTSKIHDVNELFSIFSDIIAEALLEYGLRMVVDDPAVPALVASLPDSKSRRLAVEAYKSLVLDVHYNNAALSDMVKDDEQFVCDALQGNAYFSPVIFAGQLRLLARRLCNCAADRVYLAHAGEAEFWQYLDTQTGELALLQVRVITVGDIDQHSLADVVEFKAEWNTPVSDFAIKCLREWLWENDAGNRRLFY